MRAKGAPTASRSAPTVAGLVATKRIKVREIYKLFSKLGIALFVVLFVRPVSADLRLDSVGILEAEAVKKFDGLRQHGVAIGYRVRDESDRFWVPTSLELSAGWLECGADTAKFVSFGPTYRFHIGRTEFGRWFADVGSLPTYMSNSEFHGKPLGGNFFFTSYLGVGAYLDRNRRTSFLLRYQHTSNAGVDGENPGVDMLGLTFSYHFGNDRKLFSATANDLNQ